MEARRFGVLLLVGSLGACGPNDPDAPAAGGKSGSGNAGASSSGASSGGAGSGAGGSSAGSSKGGAGASALGGSGGKGGSGGELSVQAWKDFMLQSFCPATCEQTMGLPCYYGGATPMLCVQECYVYWSALFNLCPSAIPPVTLCAFPDNHSYGCVGGMVRESFNPVCDDEVDAANSCNQ